jgi:hypothetical protein
MTSQASVTPRGSHVALEISGANGASASLELDRHQAFALIVSIAQVISALPTDPITPLHLQRPVLRSKHPSFQVGIAADGDVVLAIKPDPFPSMEFEFEAQGLSKLIADLRAAAIVPAHPSGDANN